MTATKTVHKLQTEGVRYLFDFDPNATSATIATIDAANTYKCIPIKNRTNFLFGIMHSYAAATPGDVSLVEVVAATAAAGTGATVVVSKSTTDKDIDAIGDFLWLECDIEQIMEVLSTATHVGLRITLSVATDECVGYAEARGEFQYGGQTADYAA